MKVSMQGMLLIIMITLAGVFMEEGNAQGSGGGGGGGGGGSACLNQLIPCLNYLNNQGQGQDPPDSCCDPLKSVIKSNPECLCSMISNQGTKNAENAGINVTKAQELPARCGQRVNPISCITSTSKTTPGTSDSQSLGNSMVYLLYPLMLIIAAVYA
ncbi:non-specific lipid transfer protein GPI-anchored 30 [Lactuca sativa]|uniref:Bifunctional inhibitor/plant lipid transfer protein/seed storage helical domain-containing protein n=1 Tax=Lactuca sativa TaxID=4236 RepID=A0A9R1VZL1_LACSA|nr:non-specific lipid transfer protein GPI-anchored 30 [Lactuca sativa]KAJ0213600.1 hypothetical protein LSAT_V11C400227940 [Lactuca sativa]